jgi:hypothetical protein
MANALYDHGRNAFARGLVSWRQSGGSTIRVTLVDLADYTPNLSTHQYMNTDTVPAAARIATQQLTLLDPTAGICDGNDVTFPSVSGDQAEALIIWLDGGGGGNTASGTTDLLLAIIDTATGLPVTPNGGDINVAWDNGTNRIFKL